MEIAELLVLLPPLISATTVILVFGFYPELIRQPLFKGVS